MRPGFRSNFIRGRGLGFRGSGLLGCLERARAAPAFALVTEDSVGFLLTKKTCADVPFFSRCAYQGLS